MLYYGIWIFKKKCLDYTRPVEGGALMLEVQIWVQDLTML